MTMNRIPITSPRRRFNRYHLIIHLLNHTNPCGHAARVQTCHAQTRTSAVVTATSIGTEHQRAQSNGGPGPYVRFGSKTEVTAPKSNFRFTPESRHQAGIAGGPFRAKCGSNERRPRAKKRLSSQQSAPVIFWGLAGICLVEVGDDDLLHLHHCLHDAISSFAIWITQVSAKSRGHNLPGQAEFVLEPSTFRFLAAVGN
jgi:hypothetical protein